MSAHPYMPLFVAEFVAGTTHLSAEETGAYICLLAQAWQSPGCSIPDDDRKLARWARVEPATWSAIKPEVMAFWTLARGRWTQKRQMKEWNHVGQVTEKRRAAANKRWNANGRANAYPNGMHSHSQEEPNRGKVIPTESIYSSAAAVAGATVESLDDIWPDGGDT